jgi:hypothetical protein
MRIQWISDTFCPCCQGFCISAKIYGIIRRLDIEKDSKKDGIFGEFQRDGGDFVWWHSCLPDCKGNRRPFESEIKDALSELLDDINFVEGSEDDDEDSEDDGEYELAPDAPSEHRPCWLDGVKGYIRPNSVNPRTRLSVWVSDVDGREERINIMTESGGRLLYKAPSEPIAESVTPPAAPAPVTHSWRAEVVDDAIDAELEAAAEAEMWAMARAESEAAARRMEVCYDRALKTIRRRAAIQRGERPYQPAYELTPGIVVIGDDICIEIPF